MASGLVAGSGGPKIYVKILETNNQGLPFRVKVKENTPGAIMRSFYNDKTGETKTVYEIIYKRIDNVVLRNVRKRVQEFGGSKVDSFEIEFNTTNDDPTSIVLQIPYGSLAIDFLKRLPNVNPDYPLDLSYWNFVPDGEVKSKKGFTISQMNQKVQYAWTKDTDNNWPLPEVDEKIKANKGYWPMYFNMVAESLLEYANTRYLPFHNLVKAADTAQQEIESKNAGTPFANTQNSIPESKDNVPTNQIDAFDAYSQIDDLPF